MGRGQAVRRREGEAGPRFSFVNEQTQAVPAGAGPQNLLAVLRTPLGMVVLLTPPPCAAQTTRRGKPTLPNVRLARKRLNKPLDIMCCLDSGGYFAVDGIKMPK